MATLNDFKILNTKCKSYFNLLEKEVEKNISSLTEKTKERLGFYIFMLESICEVRDVNDLAKLITDQEFNTLVFDSKDEDYGVDAVYIDEEENVINLFNFKFREKFNEDKKQGINETFLSTKFANSIVTEKTSGLSGKVLLAANQIIEVLNSNEIWKIRLYVISNDNKPVDVTSPEIAQLRDLYDLEVIPIALDNITKIMSLRPNPITAVIHLENDTILPFVENSLASSKSYVIRISAAELLRITCNNEKYRQNYSMENYNVLSDVEMEYNLLFDNVRGLIVRSKFNKNIFNTLRDEPSKFFMYNNGLTITAKDIKSEDTNANKKVKITIEDFQVVNGGQTLRTLHKFNSLDNDNITNYLSKCELLIRVFKTIPDSKTKNKIAEYTNSQNAISNIDLKSLSEEQLQIEQFLDEQNIIYARKIGDTGINIQKEYDHKISMEKFGQIVFSISGFPEKASNQKKQIFDKYYDSIFDSENFDITKSADYVKKYYSIKKEYDENTLGFEITDQKIFYILYIGQHMATSIIEQIKLFESVLANYKTEELISNARKLIQTKFKELLDEKILTR